jgi:hypothetical protein
MGNEEWVSINNKLKFLGLEHTANIDFQILINTLNKSLINLMSIKIGLINDENIRIDSISCLGRCIVSLDRKYCTEDESETLYRLNEFVKNNL